MEFDEAAIPDVYQKLHAIDQAVALLQVYSEKGSCSKVDDLVIDGLSRFLRNWELSVMPK